MNHRHPRTAWLTLVGCFLGVLWVQPARAYITVPVTTLGQLSNSTYVTLVRVEKVSKEKGVIIYTKVRDLKGKYPKETIKHVFDLKNTPAHNGPGDVPIRPDEKDWKYALQWAEPGKTAVMFCLKYDPYGDFGHTYIDGLWYATMCPRRDWEFWYSIYADPALLSRWHCGSPAQLAAALEVMLTGKDAVVPVLVEGNRDDLRANRGKIQGLKVSPKIQDYNPKRDLVASWLAKEMVPALVKSLQNPNRDQRAQAVRDLGLIGAEAKEAVPNLLGLLQDPDVEVRRTVLLSLAQVGAEAKAVLPAFTAALQDQDPTIRRGATRGLGQLGPQAKSAVPQLAALLPNHAGLERLEIADALVRIEPANPAGVAALTGLLKDADGDTRFKAVEALAQAGAPAKAATPALIEFLKGAEGESRLRAAEVLATSGLAAPEVLAVMAGLFEDPKSEKTLRLRAASSIGHCGVAAVPVLIKAMKDPDRDIRVKTAEVLAQVGPAAKAAVPVLAEVVGNDASGTVRIRAADALAKIGPEAKSAAPALKAALGDPRIAQRPEVLTKIMEVYNQLK